ncbi:glycosyltransferase family 2 protein [Thiospirillum jenense]|uniref:Glycosyltransferase family 2 protein n=1 Tax=Thiospirillum jenense TaxID=1653858 RepID=A0A839HC55_9GAMM|nr:glycosyltransferase family 2 protein [Thiospirillum jenense]MBB1126124.1 glycosyltransferase family 2 protein [Thiospirillum jenense]
MATSSQSIQISLSVVSHGQPELLQRLLMSLQQHQPTAIELIITANLPNSLPHSLDFIDSRRLPFPVHIIHNSQPRGFAANHNMAFQQAQGEWFCILNPDIQLIHDPFPVLLAQFKIVNNLGIIAPQVINAIGQLEDSARAFPTPWSLFKKVLGINRDRTHLARQLLLNPNSEVDWVAGMFMLIPRAVFSAVAGFDERYHLYYEDVDLCARIRQAGWGIIVTSHATVVHHAQRSSHRHWRYLIWHVTSLLRFLRQH